MDFFTALDAKTHFGAMLDQAQRGPVVISKNGRPVAVVISHEAFQQQQEIKLQLLRQEVRKGLDDLEQGKTVSAEEAFAALDKELAD